MNISSPPKLRALDKDDRKFINQNLLGMQNLLANVIGRKVPITPENLDAAYTAWLQGRDPQDDPESGIILFAIAFCQCIVDQTGMVWKIAEDKDGIEPVIHKEAGNILMFPISMVAKRFHQGESNFFTLLFPILCQQAGALAQQAQSQQKAKLSDQAQVAAKATAPKPFWKFW